ncbi:MAG: hypothetical protein JRJ14_10740 [Deltaproteobacteria bacterium]|nr:hypothetical protein [Deltaproteobacteria bacterium]
MKHKDKNKIYSLPEVLGQIEQLQGKQVKPAMVDCFFGDIFSVANIRHSVEMNVPVCIAR